MKLGPTVPIKYGKLATTYLLIYGYFLQCICKLLHMTESNSVTRNSIILKN